MDATVLLDGEAIVARRASLTYRLIRWARKRRAVVGLGLGLLAGALLAVGYGIRVRVQATRQQQLAQRLTHEMKDMEWLLRTARGMPLHDLEKEKQIIRRRMQALQTELVGFGKMGRPLALYALGRGHMALHEYPEALNALEQAIAQGYDQPEAHYALGIVLGKHFERALYEARLSGGGDWAKKELRSIEPRYLTPALAALSRSRTKTGETPGYLEALIAFYSRDYAAALSRAEEVQQQAPWMYEASKLSGDVHHEQALTARDTGMYEVAEKEFAAAVRSYEAAAAIGQSDAAVYEGLAETRLRQMEMAMLRGQETAEAYAATLAVSDKIIESEPRNTAALLKKAFAVLFRNPFAPSESSRRLLAEGLEWAKQAHRQDPDNPYAKEILGILTSSKASQLWSLGEDPSPLFRESQALLEGTISLYPRFLWGIGDLAQFYCTHANYLVSRGEPTWRETQDKATATLRAALKLDETYLVGYMNILSYFAWTYLNGASDEEEVRRYAHDVEYYFDKCQKINAQYHQCYVNSANFYARGAQWLQRAGQDPGPYLRRAENLFAALRRLGGSFLDAEQYSALASLVAASDRLRRGQDPTPALAEMKAALMRCYAIAAEDQICWTLAAQAEWVSADFLAQNNLPIISSLKTALASAHMAMKQPGPETTIDAHLTIAETHLRLARALQSQPMELDQHLAAGFSELKQIFVINRIHGRSRATEGSLHLLSAQTQRNVHARRIAAQAAVTGYEAAFKSRPFLRQEYDPLLAQAKALLASLQANDTNGTSQGNKKN